LGARSASLTVTDNALGSPQSIPLSGTGAQPVVQFSPSSVNLGAQTVGGTTSAQLVTLYNAGGSTLTITSIGITGANAGDFADTSACGSTLGSGASCQIKVTFTPTASGSRSAALSVSDNAPGSPQAVALSGTGQDFSLAPSGSATATVAPGQTATYTVVVTPGGGFNQTVNLSCSGAPAQATCTVSSSVTLDGVNPSMATVSVVTTASAMGLTQSDNAPPINRMFVLWLGASWILGLWISAGFDGVGLRPRQQMFRALGFVWVLGMGLTMSAGGGGGGSSGGGGTQPGTYNLTVTGTSSAAKLTNKTNLTWSCSELRFMLALLRSVQLDDKSISTRTYETTLWFRVPDVGQHVGRSTDQPCSFGRPEPTGSAPNRLWFPAKFLFCAERD
jgi:trimeric autotransporter adhesin